MTIHANAAISELNAFRFQTNPLLNSVFSWE